MLNLRAVSKCVYVLTLCAEQTVCVLCEKCVITPCDGGAACVCVCVFKYFKCCVLVNIWCTAAGTVYTLYCCGEHGRHTGDREDNADNTAKSGIYLPGGWRCRDDGINTETVRSFSASASLCEVQLSFRVSKSQYLMCSDQETRDLKDRQFSYFPIGERESRCYILAGLSLSIRFNIQL